MYGSKRKAFEAFPDSSTPIFQIFSNLTPNGVQFVPVENRESIFSSTYPTYEIIRRNPKIFFDIDDIPSDTYLQNKLLPKISSFLNLSPLEQQERIYVWKTSETSYHIIIEDSEIHPYPPHKADIRFLQEYFLVEEIDRTIYTTNRILRIPYSSKTSESFIKVPWNDAAKNTPPVFSLVNSDNMGRFPLIKLDLSIRKDQEDDEETPLASALRCLDLQRDFLIQVVYPNRRRYYNAFRCYEDLYYYWFHSGLRKKEERGYHEVIIRNPRLFFDFDSPIPKVQNWDMVLSSFSTIKHGSCSEKFKYTLLKKQNHEKYHLIVHNTSISLLPNYKKINESKMINGSDLGVYTKNHHFRMVSSLKDPDSSPLTYEYFAGEKIDGLQETLLTFVDSTIVPCSLPYEIPRLEYDKKQQKDLPDKNMMKQLVLLYIQQNNYPFTIRNIKNNMIVLQTSNSWFCTTHNRNHSKENPFVIFTSKTRGKFFCRRGGKGISVQFPMTP